MNSQARRDAIKPRGATARLAKQEKLVGEVGEKSIKNGNWGRNEGTCSPEGGDCLTHMSHGMRSEGGR